MFRCAVTGKLSKKGEKQIKLVVKTRKKSYFGPLKDEEDGSVIYRKDINGELERDDNGNPIPVLTKIGEGSEIVKELSVTQEGYDIYMSKQVVKNG